MREVINLASLFFAVTQPVYILYEGVSNAMKHFRNNFKNLVYNVCPCGVKLIYSMTYIQDRNTLKNVS